MSRVDGSSSPVQVLRNKPQHAAEYERSRPAEVADCKRLSSTPTRYRSQQVQNLRNERRSRRRDDGDCQPLGNAERTSLPSQREVSGRPVFVSMSPECRISRTSRRSLSPRRASEICLSPGRLPIGDQRHRQAPARLISGSRTISIRLLIRRRRWSNLPKLCPESNEDRAPERPLSTHRSPQTECRPVSSISQQRGPLIGGMLCVGQVEPISIYHRRASWPTGISKAASGRDVMSARRRSNSKPDRPQQEAASGATARKQSSPGDEAGPNMTATVNRHCRPLHRASRRNAEA